MKKMKTKALTLMRNDTENKKSRAGPFYLNGLARFFVIDFQTPNEQRAVAFFRVRTTGLKQFQDLYDMVTESSIVASKEIALMLNFHSPIVKGLVIVL